VQRLLDLCRLASARIRSVARRGAADQLPRRQLEQDVRQSVATFSVHATQHGLTLTATADLLRLSPRTLRQWQYDLWCRRRQIQVLGRPLLRAPVAQRNEVIDLLDELGPATGVPALQRCFPGLVRAELADLLRRYRRLWQKLYQYAPHRLRWPEPGRVWAIDFSQAPAPIDGLYSYLLAVRDLAGGMQLAWLPVPDLGAQTAEKMLASLFALHGAPLVLKMDNGSAFLADLTRALLAREQVVPLFSPPHTPRYNGAIEAGIGSLKTRTEMQAVRHGHPGFWTWDDAAAARLEANATAHPRGPQGPSPDQMWDNRTAINAAERSAFLDSVHDQRCRARQEHDCDRDFMKPSAQRRLDRIAIRRALVDHGYLLFSRRRIPLPIYKRKLANIM
jgi:transposase InsO family protein